MYTHREVQILVVRGLAVTLVTHKDNLDQEDGC